MADPAAKPPVPPEPAAGGVELQSQGDLAVGRDVVGRDKIEITIGTLVTGAVPPAGQAPAVRVLFLTANPFWDFNLDAGAEYRAIQTALSESPHAARFDLQRAEDVPFGDLPKLLLRHDPAVLHICAPSQRGTGLFLADCRPPGDWLKIQDAVDGKVVTPAAFAALADLLRTYSQNVACVVLTTTLSEAEGRELTAGASAVIGFDYLVDNKRALAFTQGFYEGLGTGRGLKAAYQIGCYRLSQVPHQHPVDPPFLVQRPAEDETAQSLRL